MVLALLGPLEVEFLINTSLIRFVVKPPYLFRASTFKASLSHLEECYTAAIEQF